MKTLRGKLIFVIATGISTVMAISLLAINFVINDNLKKDITDDIEVILNYSKSQIIDSIKVNGNANNFILIDDISKLFNCYIGFEDEFYNYNYSGKIKNEVAIDRYKKLKEDKKMLLSITDVNNQVIGTSFYPLYINEEYKGDIIIQKDFSNNYISYIKIRDILMITEVILFIAFILFMYIVIRKNTKPLEILTETIKKFGEGKRDKIKIKVSKDEIGTLAEEFEIMEEKISILQNESKEFFNRATHELKTPLTAIKGYSELLCDEAFEDEFIITAIERVNEESNKMTKLVENLLIISRQDTRINVYKELLDIEKTINNILKSLELTIQSEGIDIDLNLAEKSIETFKIEFEIIINNLINNSIKYSEDKTIKINSKKESESFIFEIENSINIEKMPKDDIFKPFIKEEGREEISSSGLGLYICKRICEKNDWLIDYKIIEEKIIKFSFKI
ncbi:MAG: histidine kinase dimerization/phospho-acceptor domain-containing protein [Sarcina sp.]